ncbi:MAG: SDR family oxidoreductase [Candidatus Accumulibacter necessarius]|jgi:NAD(P)-dependent dehydrogenase (short-subunit alcohol dehydrogenase family)|uniref:SDR family oxidoreductase n=1 Tax=Candidatus Accumulibacter necessarius TaxID=2954386 RepID=UPI002FC3CC94
MNACYICKKQDFIPHNHYNKMCLECGNLNVQKRNSLSDLTGAVVLITGCRIKVGIETAKKLLRSGATVHGTSRFVSHSIETYMREPDFEQWKDRLIIHQLDLIYPQYVLEFINELSRSVSHIDILINNAAQTIRRPRNYYHGHIQSNPLDSAPSTLPTNLAGSEVLLNQMGRLTPNNSETTIYGYPPLYAGDEDASNFPPNRFDSEGQPLDIRKVNSWIRKIDTIHPIEFLEVQLVNLISPYLLISGLRQMMEKSPRERRYIVNVSSMEGVFSKKNKNSYHPHTNIAKAGLNMLTKTISTDFARKRIFVTSVDTGWITNENPIPLHGKYRSTSVTPPLDALDGASRVLDPIFMGESSGNPEFGVLLKDYRCHDW